jgi:pilus assembly protein CpaE
MKVALRASVALDNQVDRQLVEALLSTSPRLSVIEYGDLNGSPPNTGKGDVLIVACGSYEPLVAEYISRVVREHPAQPVVLMAPTGENGFVSDAFDHGADDIVTLPAGNGLGFTGDLAEAALFTIEKAVARKRGTATSRVQKLGELICVLGLKGGSGKTLTAANLAVALAAAGKRVAAVDLDLQFGDLGLALGLAPDRTMYDLVRAGATLDSDKLSDFLAVHPSGVRVLLAPTRPDHAGVVSSEFLRPVYQLLREMHDFVIVDTPPVFTPEVIAAIDASTSACIVAALDSLSLKNTKLGLETLERMDYDSARIRLVLNRADSKVGISAQDVAAIMGRAPTTLVPSDRNITRSINEGVPIAMSSRRSDASRAFHALAGLYSDDRSDTADVSRRRRFLRRR